MADGIIGSVGVKVVPDAEGFWRDFRAKTQGGAGEAGRQAGQDWRRGFDSETSRPAVVPVRTDTTQARADMERLRRQFSGNAFRIDVGSLRAGDMASLTAATNRVADAQERLREARSELAKVSAKEGVTEEELANAHKAVARAERDQELASLRLAAAQETVAQAQDRARKAAEKQAAATKVQKDANISLLGSLMALAPAAVPLAGAAVAGGAALTAMGVAGMFAVKGIEAEMKKGTKAGVEYAALVSEIKSTTSQLQSTVAKGILPGAEQSIAKLNQAMPALSATLAQSARYAGDTAQHLVGGLVGGLQTFAPIITEVERDVDKLAARFETWATGPGGAKFAATLGTDLEHVEPLVENLVAAVGHLIAAGNTPGLVIVDELSTLAGVLRSLPIPVLTGLVTGISALKAASLVSGLMDKLATSIRGVAVAEGEAARASGARGGLASGVSFIGKVGAGYLAASIALDSFARATDNNRTSTDTMNRTLAQTAHTFDLLAHGHFGSAWNYLTGGAQKEDQLAQSNKSLENSYASVTGRLKFLGTGLNDTRIETDRLNQRSVDLIATLAHGKVAYTGMTTAQEAAVEQAKNLTANTERLAGVFDALHGKIAGAQITGISSAFAQAQSAVQANITSGEKFLKLGGDTIDTYKGVTVTLGMYKEALAKTGSEAGAVGYIRAQIDALGQDRDALAKMSAEAANASTYISDLGTKYKLTSQQIDTYTSALGINITTVEQGGSAMANAESEVGRFVAALSNGNTALDGWLAAVDTWSKSANTAADRAALIGEALRAANGDMLTYANTMVQAATANQQMVTDFKNLKRGVLDLKTGTIDYHNAAAAPLLTDLANMQTAAMNAASATYQHFNALGDASAGTKAFSVYVNDTRGALIKQATQLGLTKGEAKKLADEYFGIKNSGDLKKQIALIGQDRVLNALRGILADLDILAGKHVTSFVDVVATLHQNTGAGSGHQAGSRIATAAADGAIITAGTGPRADDVLIRVSKGEAVIPADQVARHKPLVQALISRTQGFANGGIPGESGGFTGVDYGGHANRYGHVSGSSRHRGSRSGSGTVYVVEGQQYSTLRSAENAAARLFRADVTLGVQIDTKGLRSFRSALAGTVQQADAAFQKMIGDLNKLHISRRLSTALVMENDSIEKAIRDRNAAADRLKNVMQQFTQLRDSVTQAGQGVFDLSSSGTGFNGQEPVTFGNIQAQQTQSLNTIRAWASGIKRLAGLFGSTAAGKEMVENLAGKGPGDLPEVQALLSASPKDLANMVSTQYQIDRTASDLGNFVGHNSYTQIGQLQREISLDNRTIDRIANTMGRQVEHAVEALAHRPINITVDGKTIARVTAAGARRAGR